MGRPAVEADAHLAAVGRAHDHVPDRRGLVVDEAELGFERRVVESAGAEQPDLLLLREEELDAGVRSPVGDDSPGRLDHRDDGGLVVGAEDRATCVPDDAVLDDRLERALRRNRVEVRAEEEGHAAVDASGQAAEQVARIRPDPGAGVVLLDLEPDRPKLGGDPICDGPLVAWRARDRR